jgi:hypothetical protein
MASVRELGPDETHLAYRTMQELRPQLTSVEAFVAAVNDAQRQESYRLIGAFHDGVDEPVAVAGFRTMHMLAWGQVLYVDDLVTRADQRMAGHAGLLLDWLAAEATRLGCAQLHLDSAVHRFVAHRFYFGHGMHISAYHFQRELPGGDA